MTTTLCNTIVRGIAYVRSLRARHIGVILIVILGITALNIQPVRADGVSDFVLSTIGEFGLFVVSFIGNILLVLIQQLIGVFHFSEFINTPAVEIGWVIIRDIANIAIVVALMIIAFSTVFGYKQYAASQLLVRLIIAAILVNFSRLFAGLMIDGGQVVMLTFVNAFSDIAAGNLIVGFGIEDMLAVATGDKVDVTQEAATGLLGAIILAIIMLIIAVVVMLVYIVLLLQRIIFLWLLVIFSPVAYVAPLLPGGGSYANQWWTNFSKQVIVGPVLAFGFWLAMSILAGISADQSLVRLSLENQSDTNTQDIAAFISESSTPQALFDFMVVVALLLGALGMSKMAGGFAASFAGQAQGRLKAYGSKLANYGVRKFGVTGGALLTGGVAPLAAAGLAVAGRPALRRMLAGKSPIPLGNKVDSGFKKTVGQITTRIPYLSKIASDRQKTQEKAAKAKARKFIEKHGGEGIAEVISQTKWPIPASWRGGAKQIAADVESAKRYVRRVKGVGGEFEIENTKASALYSPGAGVTKKFSYAFDQIDDAFVQKFRTGIGGLTSTREDKAKIRAWQQAVASKQMQDGSTPQLDAMEAALDALISSGRADKTTAEYKADVDYSKTRQTANVKFYSDIDKALQDFSTQEREQDKGISDEEIRKKFFRGEQAKQIYKDAFRGVGGKEEEAQPVSAHATMPTIAPAGAPQPAPTAGPPLDEKTVVTPPATPPRVIEPSADDMQEYYEKLQVESNKYKPESADTVTVGGFGLDSSKRSNVISAGFDNIEDYLNKHEGLGGVPAGFAASDSEAAHITKDDAVFEPVRNALLGILGEQRGQLTKQKEGLNTITDTGERTRQEQQIDNALSKVDRATARLKDNKALARDGLIVLNKNRRFGDAKGGIRHDEAHGVFDKLDPNKAIRETIKEDIRKNNPHMEQRIDEYTKTRSDYGKLDRTGKMEEYAADVLAGRHKDDEMRALLEQHGLVESKTRKVSEPAEEPPKPLTNEAREAIKKDPVVGNVYNQIQTAQADLFNPRVTYNLMKALKELRTATDKMRATFGPGLTQLHKDMTGLEGSMPDLDKASPLELKVFAQNNAPAIQDIVNRLTSSAQAQSDDHNEGVTGKVA